MNILEAVLWGESRLKNLDNPRLEAEVLLSAVLEQDRVFLKTASKKNLTEAQLDLYKKFVQKRDQYIPIAQILGFKIWNELKILVNEYVLIPRDETEILCLKIKDYVNAHIQAISNILDIGTGSGCIAVFLKKQFPKLNVCAVDVSSAALAMARKNAELYDLSIDFRCADLLSAFEKGECFDVIVANLPYVPERYRVTSDVSKEPSEAIFSGDDGLDLLRQLAQELKTKEIKFQALFLEFLPFQKEDIAEIFKAWKVDFLTDDGGDIFFARVCVS